MNSLWNNHLDSRTLTDTHQDGGLIPLSDHVLITVTGPDARKFLQGQCTCDINRLDQNHWLLGAHCNVKGRMLSSFTAALLADECIGLRVHLSVAESTAQALQKYIVFSKAKCEISQYLALGIIGQATLPELTATARALEDGQFTHTQFGTLLRHDADLAELWISQDTLQNTSDVQAWLSRGPLLSAQHWQQQMIVRGRAEVQRTTADTYLPQAFNYDLIGGVNFKKGCYTGQEIIARLHYKGQSKQRVHAMQLADNSQLNEHGPIEVGQTVINAQGTSVGQVVAARAGQIGTQLLICSKAFNTDNAQLFVVANETSPLEASATVIEAKRTTVHSTALEPLSLPYAIP
ncbi:MAG TPA: folate-binding protein [Marinagarivorans sp.]